MAAYASSVTIHMPRAERIGRSVGLISGTIAITNYNSTTVAETGITKFFMPSAVTGIEMGILSMDITAVTGGYTWTFDKSTGKFKVWTQASLAIANVSIADTAVTVAAATSINVTAIGSVNANHATWASANRVNVKAGIDAAVSATIVKVESAIGALATTAAVLTEAASDTDVGTASFTAIGFIR